MEKHVQSKEYYELDAHSIFTDTIQDYSKIIEAYLSEEDVNLDDAVELVNDLANQKNQELIAQEIIGCDAYVGSGATVPRLTGQGYVTEISEEFVQGRYMGFVAITETHEDISLTIPRLQHRILLDNSRTVSANVMSQTLLYATVPLYETERIGIELFTNTPGETANTEGWKQTVINELQKDQGTNFSSVIQAYEKIVFAKKSRLVTESNIDWLCDSLMQYGNLKNLTISFETSFTEEVHKDSVPIQKHEDQSINGRIIDIGVMKNPSYNDEIDLASCSPAIRWLKLKNDIALILSSWDGEGEYIVKTPLRAIKLSA